MRLPGPCTFSVSLRPPETINDYANATRADLQELRHLTKATLESMYQSTGHLPYIVRLSAREALLALRVSILEERKMNTELTLSR